MEKAKLKALVFERTGIPIDEKDPMFAVVAMNEIALEEAAQSVPEAVNRALSKALAQEKQNDRLLATLLFFASLIGMLAAGLIAFQWGKTVGATQTEIRFEKEKSSTEHLVEKAEKPKKKVTNKVTNEVQ